MWWYHVDPPCFNKKSRALIQKKTTMINNNSNNDFRCCLKHLQASLYAITFLAKEKYYHKIVKKLKNIQEISEVYWSLLKVSLNNKKTAFIPPLFHENLILNISKFFKKKKKILSNATKFLVIAPSDVNYMTILSTITFSAEAIENII